MPIFFYGTIRCQMLGQSTSFAVRLAYTSRITVDDFHNATVVGGFQISRSGLGEIDSSNVLGK